MGLFHNRFVFAFCSGITKTILGVVLLRTYQIILERLTDILKINFSWYINFIKYAVSVNKTNRLNLKYSASCYLANFSFMKMEILSAVSTYFILTTAWKQRMRICKWGFMTIINFHHQLYIYQTTTNGYRRCLYHEYIITIKIQIII